jgi:hypothetical protein
MIAKVVIQIIFLLLSSQSNLIHNLETKKHITFVRFRKDKSLDKTKFIFDKY